MFHAPRARTPIVIHGDGLSPGETVQRRIARFCSTFRKIVFFVPAAAFSGSSNASLDFFKIRTGGQIKLDLAVFAGGVMRYHKRCDNTI